MKDPSDNGDDEQKSYQEDHQQRVIREVLDDTEMYRASEGGPEGPWYYKSLKLKRRMNTIYVYDVDGESLRMLAVPDLSKPEYTDDPHGALRNKLDELHEESLDAL